MSPSSFQFLRPWWLLALLAVPLLSWLLRAGRRERDAWRRAVDPHLLPHLLQSGAHAGSHAASIVLTLGAALAILALAGPSWRQQPAPLWQVQSPLVIALDLSSAMRATDLKPSRLAQARYKLTALLQQRRGGQVGLLAFAGDAFNVAPITPDAHTVQALLDSLAPELMPVDGQRADRAIERAVQMLRGAGFADGSILLVSDHADAAALAAGARARVAGFRVGALGVGTPAGAPVAGDGGFVTGADGQVALARLDAASLAALAHAGGGRYASLAGDGGDLQALDVLDPQGRARAGTAEGAGRAGAQGVQRSDDGYWLVLLLLPLAGFGFRRGWLAGLPLALGLSAAAPSVQAAPEPAAATQNTERPNAGGFDWSALWQRPEQRARAALDRGELHAARALSHDPALQGAAAYRGDDYAGAAAAWTGLDSADAHYNRGNALARAGKLHDALAAYDAALARAPQMADALANRSAVEAFLQQQKQTQASAPDSAPAQADDPRHDGQSSPSQSQAPSADAKPQQQAGAEPGSKDKGTDAGHADAKKPAGGGDEAEDRQPNADPTRGGAKQARSSEPGGSQDAGKAKPIQRDATNANPSAPRAEQPAADAAAKNAGRPDADPSARDGTDPATQQQAKDAAKRQMEQALAGQANARASDPSKRDASAVAPADEVRARADSEQRQALEQWLRRVPDDPGGLLRRKFAREYQRRQAQGDDR